VRILVTLFLLLLSISILAQTKDPLGQPNTPSVEQTIPTKITPKIDPVKEADIQRLLGQNGVKETMIEMMAGMEKSLRPLMANSLPPGEYRGRLIDLFLEKFRSKADPQQMVNLAVPIYDKYLSDADVKGLIEFYSTPLGQKALKVLPKLVSECEEEGRKWGEGVGRESMIEVLSEHPELEKGLEEAKKAAQPH